MATAGRGTARSRSSRTTSYFLFSNSVAKSHQWWRTSYRSATRTHTCTNRWSRDNTRDIGVIYLIISQIKLFHTVFEMWYNLASFLNEAHTHAYTDGHEAKLETCYKHGLDFFDISISYKCVFREVGWYVFNDVTLPLAHAQLFYTSIIHWVDCVSMSVRALSL